MKSNFPWWHEIEKRDSESGVPAFYDFGLWGAATIFQGKKKSIALPCPMLEALIEISCAREQLWAIREGLA